MPLTHTKELFANALKGKYALGAFNVNNMELLQAIVEACEEEKAPVMLQISKGARQYANPVYLKKLIEENLEHQVFFNDARTGPVGRIGRLDERGRARFAGCAYCHEVKPVDGAAPAITQPIIPDRWLIRGRFNHAKHATIDCVKCHEAGHSRDTADILLPSKATCVTCHSPQRGVAHDCSTCHSYHTLAKTQSIARSER